MNQFYEAMQEVLERPAYDILTGRSIDHQQVIMQVLGRAIVSLLERVRFNVPEGIDYNLEAFTLIFVISSALLLLSISMAIVYILFKRMSRKNRQAEVSAAIFDDIAHKRFSLSDLLAMNREFATKNQLREAIRCYYIAVLISLDDTRIIRVDKSKTNDRLTEELAEARPMLFEPFVSVVDLFQQTWFGRKSVDESKYLNFAAMAEEILNEK